MNAALLTIAAFPSVLAISTLITAILFGANTRGRI